MKIERHEIVDFVFLRKLYFVLVYSASRKRKLNYLEIEWSVRSGKNFPKFPHLLGEITFLRNDIAYRRRRNVISWYKLYTTFRFRKENNHRRHATKAEGTQKNVLFG